MSTHPPAGAHTHQVNLPPHSASGTDPDVFRATFEAAPLEVAAADKAKGTVKALVSAYNVKYRIGYATWHTIEAGAFADAAASEDPVPLFWMHGWSWTDQFPVGVGYASETDDGLVIDGQMYISDPEVARLHAALLDGALPEWSIGYRVVETRLDPDDDRHYFVTKAELLEASSVLEGANPATQTLEVASRPATQQPPSNTTPEPVMPPAADTAGYDDGDQPLTDSDTDLRFRLLARPAVRQQLTH